MPYLHTTALSDIYCKNGNFNEQVMLMNLTSGMGSLIYLPRQQYIPYPILSLNKQQHQSSIPTVYTVSSQRVELYLAIVPQVLFTNLRETITKAKYQTLDTTLLGSRGEFFPCGLLNSLGDCFPVVY